jgi:hypothetical protein
MFAMEMSQYGYILPVARCTAEKNRNPCGEPRAFRHEAAQRQARCEERTHGTRPFCNAPYAPVLPIKGGISRGYEDCSSPLRTHFSVIWLL